MKKFLYILLFSIGGITVTSCGNQPNCESIPTLQGQVTSYEISKNTYESAIEGLRIAMNAQTTHTRDKYYNRLIAEKQTQLKDVEQKLAKAKKDLDYLHAVCDNRIFK